MAHKPKRTKREALQVADLKPPQEKPEFLIPLLTKAGVGEKIRLKPRINRHGGLVGYQTSGAPITAPMPKECYAANGFLTMRASPRGDDIVIHESWIERRFDRDAMSGLITAAVALEEAGRRFRLRTSA